MRRSGREMEDEREKERERERRVYPALKVILGTFESMNDSVIRNHHSYVFSFF